MKKKHLFVLIALLVVAATQLLFARAGGGGGFGGGFSGGFHSTPTYGYHSGNGHVIPWGVWDYILFYGFFSSLIVIFFLMHIVFWKANLFTWLTWMKISRKDPFWDMEAMKRNATKTFSHMQQAWQTQNMDKVKHLVTPELYQNYQLMLTEMKKKGERNFIKDIEFTDINIISCEDFKDNSKDRYMAHIKGNLLDYTVHEPTKKIIKNTDQTRENFTDTYHFVRSNNSWILEHIDNSVSLWDIIRLKNYTEK
jgi:hypothetical protein